MIKMEDNKILVAARNSSMPFSEYLENIEDLLATGYTVEEAIELLEDN